LNRWPACSTTGAAKVTVLPAAVASMGPSSSTASNGSWRAIGRPSALSEHSPPGSGVSPSPSGEPGPRREVAPPAPIPEERIEIPGVHLRIEGKPPDPRVVSVTGESQKQAPRSHRAGVMVAALHFVPGVPLRAVVAVAHGFDDFQALADQALVETVRGDLVLD